LNLSDDKFENLMLYIKKKELFNIEKFLIENKVNNDLKSFIQNLPKYQGDISLIKEIKESLNYNDIKKALQKLIDIHEILSAYGINKNIIYDLGEPKEFDYYTGIVFEIFIKDFKKAVGLGGRYNRLISKYNGDIPATGFAFDVINIWKYMKSKNLLPYKVEKDYFIVDLTDKKELAYKIGMILRNKGYKVGRDIVDRPLEQSLKFAFKSGYKNVIVIGVEKNTENIYIYENEKEYKVEKIEKFL